MVTWTCSVVPADVQWAENHRAKGQKRPLFKGFETLIEPGKKVTSESFLGEEDLEGPTSSTRIWVDASALPTDFLASVAEVPPDCYDVR
jgi:hypothetical protein